MDSSWYALPILLFTGIISGFINTLAGSGSALTLPVLSFLGLPANMANGTNRVAVLFQSAIGYYTFRKGGVVPSFNKAMLWLILPTVIGAILGALIAVQLDEKMMNLALGLLMVFLLGLVVFNPKKWLLDQTADPDKFKSVGNVLLFFMIGLHGGFIQAGVGVLLLSALVLSAGYSLISANSIKLLIVLAFGFPALCLFAYYGQINWYYGLLLTMGQGFGAWLAAKFALHSPNAPIWIRRLLVVVLVVGIIRFLGLWFYS